MEVLIKYKVVDNIKNVVLALDCTLKINQLVDFLVLSKLIFVRQSMGSRIKIFTLLLFLLMPTVANSEENKLYNQSDPGEYSLNKRWLNVNVHGEYSFQAVGHIYGIDNKETPFPSGTILANINNIMIKNNNLFFVSLGDIYDIQTPQFITNFKDSFLNKFDIPIFNAVGNHDVVDKKMYVDAFDIVNTFFYFVIRDSLFVFLDTEQAIISGEQANFLTEVAEKHQGMKNLFVFTHKLFWRKQNPDSYLFRSRPLKVMLDKSSPVTCFIGERFLADNIYIMSGDINKKWLLPLLYAQSGKMKFFAVGNGDTVNDALLSVKVDSNDDVKFELLSLTGKLLNQPDNYNIAKKDFYSTNLSRMTFVRKIYYFIKYPFHLALLLALFALFVILFLANKIRKQH